MLQSIIISLVFLAVFFLVNIILYTKNYTGINGTFDLINAHIKGLHRDVQFDKNFSSINKSLLFHFSVFSISLFLIYSFPTSKIVFIFSILPHLFFFIRDIKKLDFYDDYAIKGYSDSFLAISFALSTIPFYQSINSAIFILLTGIDIEMGGLLSFPIIIAIYMFGSIVYYLGKLLKDKIVCKVKKYRIYKEHPIDSLAYLTIRSIPRIDLSYVDQNYLCLCDNLFLFAFLIKWGYIDTLVRKCDRINEESIFPILENAEDYFNKSIKIIEETYKDKVEIDFQKWVKNRTLRYEKIIRRRCIDIKQSLFDELKFIISEEMKRDMSNDTTIIDYSKKHEKLSRCFSELNDISKSLPFDNINFSESYEKISYYIFKFFKRESPYDYEDPIDDFKLGDGCRK